MKPVTNKPAPQENINASRLLVVFRMLSAAASNATPGATYIAVTLVNSIKPKATPDKNAKMVCLALSDQSHTANAIKKTMVLSTNPVLLYKAWRFENPRSTEAISAVFVLASRRTQQKRRTTESQPAIADTRR